MIRSTLAVLAALAASALATAPAQAQDTAEKFQLDGRFEGPAALFLWPAARGHFKAEKLDMSVGAGNSSGATVTRVASGVYDMGLADLAAVLSLSNTGTKAPRGLAGRKFGAPVFDAGRKAWPIFDKANGVGRVEWVGMDPSLRETMLARGVKAEDVSVLPYPE